MPSLPPTARTWCAAPWTTALMLHTSALGLLQCHTAKASPLSHCTMLVLLHAVSLFTLHYAGVAVCCDPDKPVDGISSVHHPCHQEISAMRHAVTC